ncbi:hypothetical protein SCHPADRAFT_892398 [Schizopora paradoxa]|uniref:Uncharacterized protein n=1 Tax=Schizopora paradoxa TaxID=27342 RepID=A0A0H2REW4_9AGAM|nr:hypothetical protein SCHPADRAFT_892398 [Schizopora paradoxa]
MTLGYNPSNAQIELVVHSPIIKSVECTSLGTFQYGYRDGEKDDECDALKCLKLTVATKDDDYTINIWKGDCCSNRPWVKKLTLVPTALWSIIHMEEAEVVMIVCGTGSKIFFRLADHHATRLFHAQLKTIHLVYYREVEFDNDVVPAYVDN